MSGRKALDKMPRITVAEKNDIIPGESRRLTAWFKYDWASLEKQLLLEPTSETAAIRTETECMYNFSLILPPFVDSRKDIELLAAHVYQEDLSYDPDIPKQYQVARSFFTAASSIFHSYGPDNPLRISWEGDVFDYKTNSFIVSYKSGDAYEITIRKLNVKENET
jgi:hypothetical protein